MVDEDIQENEFIDEINNKIKKNIAFCKKLKYFAVFLAGLNLLSLLFTMLIPFLRK